MSTLKELTEKLDLLHRQLLESQEAVDAKLFALLGKDVYGQVKALLEIKESFVKVHEIQKEILREQLKPLVLEHEKPVVTAYFRVSPRSGKRTITLAKAETFGKKYNVPWSEMVTQGEAFIVIEPLKEPTF